jgi:4-hydroxybenzoate polyprenyltransferase
MFSFSSRACLTARPCVNSFGVNSFPRVACSLLYQELRPEPPRIQHAVQRRKYAGPNRKVSKASSAQNSKPTKKDHPVHVTSLGSTRAQLNDVYRTPTKGFISYLPKSWIPYAELARLDKPTGTVYLWLPCAFSTILAGSMTSPVMGLGDVYGTAALFLAGAFVMRGAGCTVNDLWDRNLDPHVERTKFRPIARGAVSPLQASTFLGGQLLAGLAILLQFPTPCLYYGIPSLLLVGTYPLAKRVTNYPQFVLGLTFSWGAIMGFPAMGIDLFSDTNALKTAACLYASCIAWTMNYDMVYAYMDIKDDVKAGIKSIARAHEHNPEPVLIGLAAAQAALLAAAAYLAGAAWYHPWMFATGTFGGNFILITIVDFNNPASCLWYFKASSGVVGFLIVYGLFINHLEKVRDELEAAQSLAGGSEESMGEITDI